MHAKYGVHDGCIDTTGHSPWTGTPNGHRVEKDLIRAKEKESKTRLGGLGSDRSGGLAMARFGGHYGSGRLAALLGAGRHC